MLRACQIACPDTRGYHLFTLSYQLCIFVSILSSLVDLKVIQANKDNKDLSTPDYASQQHESAAHKTLISRR